MQSTGRNFGLDLDDDDNHHVFDEDAFINVTMTMVMMNDDGDGNDNDDASPLFFKIFLFVVISSSFCKSRAIYKSVQRSSFLSIMQMDVETKAIEVYHILGQQI